VGLLQLIEGSGVLETVDNPDHNKLGMGYRPPTLQSRTVTEHSTPEDIMQLLIQACGSHESDEAGKPVALAAFCEKYTTDDILTAIITQA